MVAVNKIKLEEHLEDNEHFRRISMGENWRKNSTKRPSNKYDHFMMLYMDKDHENEKTLTKGAFSKYTLKGIFYKIRSLYESFY